MTNKYNDNVPCNGCYKCCQRDLIFIHPECGDDDSQYETVIFQGRKILAHKPNGDCVYLDRKIGCVIHGHAPSVCREFDCRISVPKLEKEGLAHMIPKQVRKQAHKMIKLQKKHQRREKQRAERRRKRDE